MYVCMSCQIWRKIFKNTWSSAKGLWDNWNPCGKRLWDKLSCLYVNMFYMDLDCNFESKMKPILNILTISNSAVQKEFMGCCWMENYIRVILWEGCCKWKPHYKLTAFWEYHVIRGLLQFQLRITYMETAFCGNRVIRGLTVQHFCFMGVLASFAYWQGIIMNLFQVAFMKFNEPLTIHSPSIFKLLLLFLSISFHFVFMFLSGILYKSKRKFQFILICHWFQRLSSRFISFRPTLIKNAF